MPITSRTLEHIRPQANGIVKAQERLIDHLGRKWFHSVRGASEAGISMHDYLPDEGAPSDGGGRMQLLGTPAAIGDDTGSTWGGSVGNHQKLTQTIAPDYTGPISCRVHYSKSGGAVMYIDPLPGIA